MNFYKNYRRLTVRSNGILLLVFILVIAATPVLPQGMFGDPSNLVGVWKMNLQPGAHLVSFPVLPTNATINEVLGDQLPGGTDWESSTRIITYGINAVRASYYDSNLDQWIGTLNDLEQEKGYWLIIPDNAAPVTLLLTGAAMEAEEINMGTLSPGVNLVGTGFPFPTSLAASGLVESGLTGGMYSATSDHIYTWYAGHFYPAWYHQDNGWQGSSFSFEPGKGYIVVVTPGHQAFNWYQPRPQYSPGEEELFQPLSPGNFHTNTLPITGFDRPPWGDGDPPLQKPVKRISTPTKTVNKTGRTGR